MFCYKKLIPTTFALMMGFFSTAAFATRTGNVMITGDYINTVTSIPYRNFIFRSISGYPDYVYLNVHSSGTSTIGRFIINQPVGTSTDISITFYDSDFTEHRLCILEVTAIDDQNATIKQIYQDNSSIYKCDYDGDPSNNTATITISNNQGA